MKYFFFILMFALFGMSFADSEGIPDQIFFPATSDPSEVYISVKGNPAWLKLKLSNFSNDEKKFQRIYATVLAAKVSQTAVLFGTLGGTIDQVYYITSR